MATPDKGGRLEVAKASPKRVTEGLKLAGIRVSRPWPLLRAIASRSFGWGLTIGTIPTLLVALGQGGPSVQVIAVLSLASYVATDALVGLLGYSTGATPTPALEKARASARGAAVGVALPVAIAGVVTAKIDLDWKIAAILTLLAVALRTRGDDALAAAQANEAAQTEGFDVGQSELEVRRAVGQRAAAYVQTRIYAGLTVVVALGALLWPDHGLGRAVVIVGGVYALVLVAGGAGAHAATLKAEELNASAEAWLELNSQG